MDLENEEIYYLKLNAKRKNQNYIPKLECLELKPRTRRQGKCVGAALELFDGPNNNLSVYHKKEPESTYISNDVWFHLASYIAPEDVQSYALICSQSAKSINSRGFWLHLYREYCQQSSGKEWDLQLPANLQMHQIKMCDKNTLKQRVIKALFYCYEPFKERLKLNYKLETLEGRTFIASWHKQVQCVWIMCYKFKHNFPVTNNTAKGNDSWLRNEQEEIVVNDWESLADDETKNFKYFKPSVCTNDLNGVSILMICCDRFIPFPSDIVYNHSTTSFRLAASRELLSTDMRSTNLELDFVSATKDQTITVQYANIKKFKVLPWWHPDFRIFNKCE